MKCPKCNYVSHDWLDKCKNCQKDLTDFKEKYGIWAIKPGMVDYLQLAQGEGKEPPFYSPVEVSQSSSKTELAAESKFSPDTLLENAKEEAEAGLLTSKGPNMQEEESSGLSIDFDLDLIDLESSETSAGGDEEADEAGKQALEEERMELTGPQEEESLTVESLDSGNGRSGSTLQMEEEIPEFELEDSLGDYAKIEDNTEAGEEISLESGLDLATEHLGEDFAKIEQLPEASLETVEAETDIQEEQERVDPEKIIDLELDEEEITAETPWQITATSAEDQEDREKVVELEDEILSLDLRKELDESEERGIAQEEPSESLSKESPSAEEKESDEDKEVPIFELNLDDLNLEDLNLDDLEGPEIEKDSTSEVEEEKD